MMVSDWMPTNRSKGDWLKAWRRGFWGEGSDGLEG